jgi:hypothetical protein
MTTTIPNTKRDVFFHNTRQQIITDHPKTNSFLTFLHNTGVVFTRTQKQFLKKAWSIVTIQQRPFCFVDFKLISKGNFRQKINELKGIVTKYDSQRNTKPQFYTLQGIILPGSSHKIITDNPMGVCGSEMYHILVDDLKLQSATVNDLKIQFDTDLHSKLIEIPCSIDPHNHSILLTDLPTLGNNITAKILVYPTKAQIDIGCTYKPFIYDVSGLVDLTFYLGMIYQHLQSFVRDSFDIPLVSKWTITHYHFGKDGSISLNGQNFHYNFEEFNAGMIRFYSKDFPDGSVKARVEQIITPRRSLQEELEVVLH